MKSLFSKWMLGITSLIVLTLGLLLMCNMFFLDDFYLFKTKSEFDKEYNYLCSKLSNNESFRKLISERSGDNGLKYYVVDKNNNIIISSLPDSKLNGSLKVSKAIGDVIRPMNNTQFYGIIKRDSINKSDVVFIGDISLKNKLLIVKPLENLLDSAKIANDFFLIIGPIILLLALLLAYFLAKKAVYPITKLTNISRKISNLDFSQEYRGTSKDEIGVLGKSINDISHKLDKTICDLKHEMELQKRFLASVSHEFKSPVGLIRGYSESLSLGIGQSEDDIKEFSSIITQEADRLNYLVTDLLLLLKMGSTSFTLNRSNFNLTKTLSSVISKYDQLNSGSYSLSLEAAENIEYLGDEKRIIQVVDNLINNAIRHSVIGGNINIDLKYTECGITLTVQNQGDSIPEKDIPFIFDPFYTANESRNREKSGTGLGLSIVKNIIEKHGGTIEIFNKDNWVLVKVELPFIL